MPTPTQPVLYPATYTRGVTPTDNTQLLEFLLRELQKLEDVIRRTDRRLTAGGL